MEQSGPRTRYGHVYNENEVREYMKNDAVENSG